MAKDWQEYFKVWDKDKVNNSYSYNEEDKRYQDPPHCNRVRDWIDWIFGVRNRNDC